MKTLIKTTVLLLSILVFAISCRKDDNSDTGSNSGYSYTYMGKTYKIQYANYTQPYPDEVYFFIRAEGVDNDIQFRFNSNNSINSFPVGNFTMNQTANNIKFIGGQIGSNNVAFTKGTINISKSGDTYTIDFDVTAANGNAKGNHKGTVPKF